jgi:hypothetical protein
LDGKPHVVDMTVFCISDDVDLNPALILEWVRRSLRVVCIGTKHSLSCNPRLTRYARGDDHQAGDPLTPLTVHVLKQ